MSNVIERILNAQGHTVEIFLDDSPNDPRENDNIGTMCLFHRRYILGDKHDFNSPEDLKLFINEMVCTLYEVLLTISLQNFIMLIIKK